MGQERNLRRRLQALRPGWRDDLQGLTRLAAARAGPRAVLNRVYGWLPAGQQAWWHAHLGPIFRDDGRRVAPGTWRIRFAGRPVSLPLTGSETGLEWDAALAALGHEPEIKATYATLLGLQPRPRLFYDVGASYGLHSLLFLVHGVATVSFEPNPRCHAYARRVAALNGVSLDLRAMVLGDREGQADLWFPPDQTWLGTADPTVRDRLLAGGRLESVPAPCSTLDACAERDGRAPDLVKIDVEGAELAVLRGARRTLREHRPRVIVEIWPGGDRPALAAFLEEAGYRLVGLPVVRGGRPPTLLSSAAFQVSRDINFLALPREDPLLR